MCHIFIRLPFFRVLWIVLQHRTVCNAHVDPVSKQLLLLMLWLLLLMLWLLLWLLRLLLLLLHLLLLLLHLVVFDPLLKALQLPHPGSCNIARVILVWGSEF